MLRLVKGKVNRLERDIMRLRSALPADSREDIGKKLNRTVAWVDKRLAKLRRDPQRFGFTIGRASPCGEAGQYYDIDVNKAVKLRHDTDGSILLAGTIQAAKTLITQSTNQSSAVKLATDKKQFERPIERRLRSYQRLSDFYAEETAAILEELQELDQSA